MNADVVFADAQLFQKDDPTTEKRHTVVVVQDGPLNEAYSYPLIRVAPVTTTVRVKQPTDIPLTPEDDGVKVPCFVRLGHVQSVLKNDLQHNFRDVSEEAQKSIMAIELWLLGQLSE